MAHFKNMYRAARVGQVGDTVNIDDGSKRVGTIMAVREPDYAGVMAYYASMHMIVRPRYFAAARRYKRQLIVRCQSSVNWSDVLYDANGRLGHAFIGYAIDVVKRIVWGM